MLIKYDDSHVHPRYKAFGCDDFSLWNGADPHTVSKNACWDATCTIYSSDVSGSY